VETPTMPDAERLELIRSEIEQHAVACVEFYGRVRPDKVTCESDVIRVPADLE
jgi:hypothetical protein